MAKMFSDEFLIKTLRRFYETHRRSPTQDDFTAANGYPSYKVYRDRFDTWNNALRRANVPLNKDIQAFRPKVYSDAQLLSILRQVTEKLGREPKYMEFKFRCGDVPAVSLYAYRFGSWAKALEAAGLKSHRYRSHNGREKQVSPKVFLLEKLLVFERRNGRFPTYREVRKHVHPELPTMGAYLNAFESWSEAKQTAIAYKKMVT